VANLDYEGSRILRVVCYCCADHLLSRAAASSSSAKAASRRDPSLGELVDDLLDAAGGPTVAEASGIEENEQVDSSERSTRSIEAEKADGEGWKQEYATNDGTDAPDEDDAITGQAEEAVESESDRGLAQEKDGEAGAVRDDEVSEASNSVERRARRNYPKPKWSSRDVRAAVDKDPFVPTNLRKAREERAEKAKGGKK
jgi:hypothetical protein